MHIHYYGWLKLVISSRGSMNQLTSIDWNTFAAIYEEQSLRQAAENLHLTQQAVSHRLKKLNQVAREAVFVHEPKSPGQSIVATPYAHHLYQVYLELQRLENRIEDYEFDPEITECRFNLVMGDHMEALLLPPLSGVFMKQAPNLSVASTDFPQDYTWNKNQTALLMNLFIYEQKDLVIKHLVAEEAKNFHTKALHTFDWVMLCSENYDSNGELTLEQYRNSNHVAMVETLGNSALSSLGTGQRKITALPAHCALLPELILRDPFHTTVSVLPRYLAKFFVGRMKGLTTLELPTEMRSAEVLPHITLGMIWHEATNESKRHQWLRDRVEETFLETIA